MRVLKKKKDRGQYEKQDPLFEVEDKRFKVKERPMYHKNKMEDMKNQPMFQKNPKKEDIKRHRSNSHMKASNVQPPDSEMMKIDNENKSGKNKKEKKKLAILIIGKKMKGKK